MGTVTPAVDIHNFSDGLNGNSIRLENREGYVTFINDANGLYLDADSHYFRSKLGSTYATIASNGNVRIGNGSPALAVGSGLEIDTGGAATLRLEDSGSGSSFEIQNTGGSIKQRICLLYTSPSPRD